MVFPSTREGESVSPVPDPETNVDENSPARDKPPRKKTGPPPRTHRMTKKITVWCYPEEKVKIAELARRANLSMSEFLRKNGLNKVVRIPRTLPGEVLAFMGEIRTANGLLYRIARKRDNQEVLNVMERAGLEELGRQLKVIADKITNKLQL